MTEKRQGEPVRRGLGRLRRSAVRTVRLLRRAAAEKSYLQRPENMKSLRHLFEEIKRALRAVLPRKGSGWVRFGGTDPYRTGQVMQLAALFYPLYGKRIEVIPEFEEPTLETKLQVSGRIYLWQLLLAGLRLMLDKNLRKMYRHFSKGEKPAGKKPRGEESVEGKRTEESPADKKMTGEKIAGARTVRADTGGNG